MSCLCLWKLKAELEPFPGHYEGTAGDPHVVTNHWEEQTVTASSLYQLLANKMSLGRMVLWFACSQFADRQFGVCAMNWDQFLTQPCICFPLAVSNLLREALEHAYKIHS